VWGAINGAFLIVSIWTEGLRSWVSERLGLSRHPVAARAWKICVTFLLVCVAWIFFRARNLSEALYIFTHLFTGWSSALTPHGAAGLLSAMGLSRIDLVLDLLLILMIQFLQRVESRNGIRRTVERMPTPVRWGIYYALIFGTVFMGVFAKNQFIYFQF
jgi:alginate O-acetyltransferase complex protein AlgI